MRLLSLIFLGVHRIAGFYCGYNDITWQDFKKWLNDNKLASEKKTKEKQRRNSVGFRSIAVAERTPIS